MRAPDQSPPIGPLATWPPAWSPRAVVFDCDGLLIDTEAEWVLTQRAYIDQHGAAVTDEQWRHLAGRTIETVVRALAEVTQQDPYAAGDELKAMHIERQSAAPVLMPGAVETVRAIAAKVPVAIASNSPRELLDAAIAQIGVADVLDASVSEDDVEHPKPAPDIYRLAAQRLGADPAEALAFEDSETGARAAFDAGLQVIAVPSMPGQSPIAHRTLTALLSHLPKSRQTLLFSATQTESVADLARLSLKDPVRVGIEETVTEGATPKALEQHYVLCELDKKLDVLWSFIKSHLQTKTLVFMSSCKQVRFVFETFCKMHPGIPLLHLHGKQKQMTRLATFQRFTSMKHAVLFATDIAARGLDFPSVDWVLQVDAPEDAETYIHRVGRTARYESAGKGLLFLMPSEEEGMVAALKKKNIDIQKIKIKASKTQSITNQLQKLAFQDPEIKYLGQRVRITFA